MVTEDRVTLVSGTTKVGDRHVGTARGWGGYTYQPPPPPPVNPLRFTAAFFGWEG